MSLIYSIYCNPKSIVSESGRDAAKAGNDVLTIYYISANSHAATPTLTSRREQDKKQPSEPRVTT